MDIEEKKMKPSSDKKEIEKLTKFYTKNGFHRTEDTQYLVKNMDYRY